MHPWPRVKHLFERDDGSLPDIFVENLLPDEIVVVYEWILGQCTIAGHPTLWSLETEQDIPIREVRYPARAYVQRKVESFRHCLAGLFVGKVELPMLSICVESEGISFDYRMGSEWGESEVLALFELLRQLCQLAPHARILQADEGGYSHPNIEFSKALQAYAANADALSVL